MYPSRKYGMIYLFLFFGPSMLLGQVFSLDRVEPPFWWVGMAEPSVELMIHGENLAGAQVKLAGEGIAVQGITQLENPNYLFLTLEIDPTLAQPGFYNLVIQKPGQTNTIRYELKAREPQHNRIQGVETEDLIYLLMPDRFANGDPTNDEVSSMKENEVERAGQYQRHGGDLQGVIDHLDYLQELGVTTLWMNPYEENDQPHESYHGYAATDHYRVDPRLGNNQLFKELVDACHERGMKVIRDVVYNHVGNEHWFIRDLPAKNWVHQFEEFTRTTYRAPTLLDPYASKQDRKLMTDGWFDHHMPDLNQDHPQLANYLIQNSIWWIEFAGLDGYRIDTYAYPDQAFMAKLGKRLKQEYPQFTFFGETWVHGVPVQAWFTEKVGGKDLDSELPGVTDFQLYYAINDALTKDFGWTDGLARLYYTLAKDYVYHDPNQLVTFLDNHDLGRYFSVVGEDLNKFKQGVGFLLTTRGIPQLYYGTEILMKNHWDPSNHDKVREEFPGGWDGDTQNKFEPAGRTQREQEAFEFVKTLANFRKNSSAITQGKLMQFVPEEGVYTYFRYDEAQTVMLVMNQNAEPKEIQLARFTERTEGFSTYREVIGGKRGSLGKELSVPGNGILILELTN
ncbi:MAG: glycoside hydrolase family 13 protein [Bacteroidota bacterium]